MSDAPKPRRRWLRFALIALAVLFAIWLAFALSGGGQLFNYDTF